MLASTSELSSERAKDAKPIPRVKIPTPARIQLVRGLDELRIKLFNDMLTNNDKFHRRGDDQCPKADYRQEYAETRQLKVLGLCRPAKELNRQNVKRRQDSCKCHKRR